MLRTIKSTREIDSLFAGGKRAAGRLVIILAGRTPEGRGPQGRVAFIAGRKLGNAVTRNRAKRVLRAAVARAGLQWPGWDVAIIARPGVTSAPADQVDAAIRAALTKAGISDG